jgi:RNA polymerase primary sigma factor
MSRATITSQEALYQSDRFSVPSGLTPQEVELYAQVPSKAAFVPHSSFTSPATEDKLFGQDAVQVARPQWTGFTEIAEDIKPRTGRTSLRSEDEVQLFLQYNYARYRLAKLVKMQTVRASLSRARQMLLWHQRACTARDSLVAANMALVLSMAKKVYFSSVEFTDLVSEGNMALLRSVEKFDVSRGFKFSTYACGSILKSFGRLAQKVGRYRHFFPTEFDPEMEHSDPQAKHTQQWGESVDALVNVLAKNRAGLSKLERTVIMERFAIQTKRRPRTLAEVGQLVGLTNERVRQIQNLALGKIREALDV